MYKYKVKDRETELEEIREMSPEKVLEAMNELRRNLWHSMQKEGDLKDQICAKEADILELYRAIRLQSAGDRLGMKLVPWEPTERQIDNARQYLDPIGMPRDRAKAIYKAMVSAAPGPDKETPQYRGVNASLMIIDEPIAPHGDKPGASTTAVDNQDREGVDHE